MYNIYSDYFAVYKQNLGVNLVAGYQLTFLKRFTVEGYTGIGLMAVEIENTHREFSENDSLYGTDLVPLFEEMNLSEYSDTKRSFTCGLRLGILL